MGGEGRDPNRENYSPKSDKDEDRDEDEENEIEVKRRTLKFCYVPLKRAPNL